MLNVEKPVVRSLTVECILSRNNEFKEGACYLADMDVTGQWWVTDMWGERYLLESSMWGRLIYKANGKHFRFEPSED